MYHFSFLINSRSCFDPETTNFFSSEYTKQTRKFVIFIIRVKRELKRVYGNGCRYNERLNAEAGGS